MFTIQSDEVKLSRRNDVESVGGFPPQRDMEGGAPPAMCLAIANHHGLRTAHAISNVHGSPTEVCSRNGSYIK